MKLYYSHSEVARKLDISPRTISGWSNKICQLHSYETRQARGTNSKLRYTEKDVQRIRTIKALLSTKKYTIKGVIEVLREIDFYYN